MSYPEYECRQSIERAARAYPYLMGTLTGDEANHLIYDCQPIAGWWPLACFTAESVLEQALDRYKEHPALRGLVEQACERVASKWGGDDGHLADGAEEWALDLVDEYAKDDGIILEPTEDYADLTATTGGEG